MRVVTNNRRHFWDLARSAGFEHLEAESLGGSRGLIPDLIFAL
jgi:hypothetical protein